LVIGKFGVRRGAGGGAGGAPLLSRPELIARRCTYLGIRGSEYVCGGDGYGDILVDDKADETQGREYVCGGNKITIKI